MFFNKKSSKTSAMLTKLVAVFMAVVIFGLLTGAVLDAQTKHITLVLADEFTGSEKTQELTTRRDSVAEFLEENGIVTGKHDRMNMDSEDELYDKARLVIKKGRNFVLNIDGNIEFISTTKKTVGEAFEEAGILLNPEDRAEPGTETLVTDDLNVTVHRVCRSTVSEDEAIPFTTKEVKDASLEKGKTKIKVRGQNGILRKTYDIKTEDGVEIKRVLVSEETVKQPVQQVVAIGTKAKKTVTASGKTLNYSKKLQVTATAYTESAGNRTASGRPAQYGVIAVDPKVIPLGTKLYVESTDDGKTWKYGYCVAGDTGGAIKGNKIDLYYNSEKECLQFGRRSAIVYVLN